MGAKDSVLTGSAGEHYVLYQLLTRSLLASLSPANAYAADIIVFSPTMSVGSMVQVKTRTQGVDGGWHMRAAHEYLVHDRLFYAFLDLGRDRPVTYVIPSAKVAAVLRDAHAAWLSRPGVGGRAHRDNPLRRLLPRYSFEVPGVEGDWMEQYRERWEYLQSDETPATAASGAGSAFTYAVTPSSVDPRKPVVYAWEAREDSGLLAYQFVGRSVRGLGPSISQCSRQVELLLAGKATQADSDGQVAEPAASLAAAARRGCSIALRPLSNATDERTLQQEQRRWRRILERQLRDPDLSGEGGRVPIVV
jgi:hypothetical protein